MKERGFIPLQILIILVLIIGGLVYLYQSSIPKTVVNPPKPSTAEKSSFLQKPTEKPYELPTDLPKNIGGKISYLKKFIYTYKGVEYCCIVYSQLLDLNKSQKVLSDKFNNSPFTAPYFGTNIGRSWSPDGSKLMIQSDSESFEISQGLKNSSTNEGYPSYLYDIQKSYTATALDNNVNSYQPAKFSNVKATNMVWSPDGKKIAYWTFEVDRNEGSATMLTINKLRLLNLDTNQTKTLLTSGDKSTNIERYLSKTLAWSPNGSKILLEDSTYTTDNLSTSTAYIDVSTAKISTVLEHAAPLDWLSDNEIVVNDKSGIFIYNIQSKNKRYIINGRYADHLSPDKKFVLFNTGSSLESVDINNGFTWPTTTDKNSQLAIEQEFLKSRAKFTTQLPQGLILNDLEEIDPISWSPDSKFLAVALRSEDNKLHSIWILDIENKKFIKVPQFEDGYAPKWGK